MLSGTTPGERTGSTCSRAQEQLGLFQKLSLGGPQALFCHVGGEGCFVDNVSEGWGVGG